MHIPGRVTDNNETMTRRAEVPIWFSISHRRAAPFCKVAFDSFPITIFILPLPSPRVGASVWSSAFAIIASQTPLAQVVWD